MKVAVYNIQAKKVSDIDVPEILFDAKYNDSLLSQVVLAMQANARTPVAHTKTRGEVSGGGRKPWKQKGTGRARHGSIRSPIWVGGGVAHGPRNDKSYKQKINKKMRARALALALTHKLADNEILFVDDMKFEEPKTAKAKEILTKLATIENFDVLVNKKYNATLIVVPEKDKTLQKSFSNFGNTHVMIASNLNPVETLRYKRVIFVNPEKVIEVLQSRFEK